MKKHVVQTEALEIVDEQGVTVADVETAVRNVLKNGVH